MSTKKIQRKLTLKKTPLLKIVTIPPKSFPSTNIVNDDILEVKNYLPSASTYEIVERFCAGLQGAKSGRMLSITGPYGSGKSTMALFLKSLVFKQQSKEWKHAYDILRHGSADTAKMLVDARVKSGIHKDGMIQCISLARREPISVTILRALDSGATKYFGKYSNNDFSQAKNLHHMINALPQKIPTSTEIISIVTDLCSVAPVMIMIDEFGKSIEYFTTNETQQSDLFLLQELAEMSGRLKKIPLSIITLQHMAFEEYAVGSSIAQKQEWSKIQGRFEDIPFANSPDQTRLLVSKTIKLNSDSKISRPVNIWAKKEVDRMKGLGINGSMDHELVASCYPLSPLALEILPELCSRYGQYERTLLSFISGGGKHTVATFIDESHYINDSLPVMGIDTLYDYFIYGTNMIHSSSANITRLIEIDTIIRDAHGLSEIENKVLKIIGLLNLIGRSGYLRASRKMIEYAIDDNAKQVLKTLEKKSIITYRKHADEYRIWHGTDIDIAATLDTYRKQYQKFLLPEMLQEIMNLDPIIAAKHSIETGTMRLFERCFVTHLDVELGTSDGLIIYADKKSEMPKYNKPVIMVMAKDTTDLRRAAIEVKTIRDILNSNEDVIKDWVARKELEERLANAEIRLDREFTNSYTNSVRWRLSKSDKIISETKPLSSLVSKICDKAYSDTPRIYNEMINKTVLSSQGTAAKRLLLERMIAHPDKPRFGLEGYGS